MIYLTVVFDDHHVISAREMAITAQRNWSAKLVTRSNNGNVTVLRPDHLDSGCEFCKPAIRDADASVY